MADPSLDPYFTPRARPRGHMPGPRGVPQFIVQTAAMRASGLPWLELIARHKRYPSNIWMQSMVYVMWQECTHLSSTRIGKLVDRGYNVVYGVVKGVQRAPLHYAWCINAIRGELECALRTRTEPSVNMGKNITQKKMRQGNGLGRG